MIEETFYVYKDNKSGMYLKLITDSGYYSSGGDVLVLIPDFKDAFRVNDPEKNKCLEILNYRSEYSPNGVDIWDDFSLMKAGIRNRRKSGDLEIIVEKYCTQTIFLESRLLKNE